MLLKSVVVTTNSIGTFYIAEVHLDEELTFIYFDQSFVIRM